MTKDYSEILISNEPDNAQFHSLADRIRSEFKAELIERVDGLDSRYWDFRINENLITLHQQHYIGIAIFPKDLKDAKEVENLLAEKIGFKLKYSTSDYDTWVKIKDQAEAEINYVLENVQESRSDRTEYKFWNYKDYAKCEGHEHCDICNTVISCNNKEDELYSTLRHTVCPDCYKKYVKNDNYLNEIEGLEKIKKLPPTMAIPNKGFITKLKGWFS